MRLLLYKRKSSPFFLGLSLPSSRALSKLERDYPALSALLFGGDDETEDLVRVSTLELADQCASYLAENEQDSKRRHAKLVEWYCSDRDRTFGPAKGLTGFSAKGVRGIASIEDGRAEIKLGKTTKHIVGDAFPVDSGHLRVHYSKGTGIYEFIFLIAESLSGVKAKTILVQIEY